MAATNTTAKKPAKSTSAKKTAEKIAQTTEQKLVQLLADTPVQIFPYSRLSHTGLNTRIIPHTDQEVEEMADSIQAMGILQNLIGAELPDGTIGIVGGEGRRRGTGILVMRGVLDADTPFVPVKVLPVEMAVAASMIENGRRKNMHPAEQIIGFRTLQQEGKTASQIGALMGYHPRHVQRCLKLANLAPSLLDALARDEISLEQCEVLTLADTHERQEQVWKEAVVQWRDPAVQTLRKMVTDDKMAISHPMFEYVGEEAYTRHAFNKTEAWEPGMVVKRGDRYQDVVAVDRNGSTVTVRDEEGKIALVSPKELITGDVQLFRRSEMEVRSGDLLKFTATDREQGQMANQRYTVESVSEEGNIRLKGENGRVTINPEKVRAQQLLDYGWAVTGYGAQGASSDYVIALEGTKDGRKALASRRAFYISASRVKEHVQIYTDGKADWVKAVKTPERDIKTAHDALAPETQRKQAKAIWAMGQPVNKTAIGRAWVRHQGMQDASLTAKIIPATRRFPEPALALPVYDNNGRSAGLALVSLVASPEGRMTQGETRMVMTERARGAVLQRSQSGNTIVASDLTAALDAVRNNPKDGVVWQTGDEPPSAWLLKVSGGTKQDVSPGIVSTLTDEQSVQQLREQMLADLVRNEEASRSRQPESLLAEVPQEEVIRLKPEDINPRKPEPLNPDADVIARVRGEENTDGREIKAAAGVRSELEGADKASGEQSRASRVIADLANAERDMLRAAENTERGRTPEREEQTLTRTIQKER